MDHLPLIPAMKMIDYLSIEDVLNLKLVNKWFYQFINGNVRIQHLVLSTGHYDFPPNKRWFYTYELISIQNVIKYVLDDNVYLNLKQSILSELRQLYIDNTTIILETLNSLDRLVHLEISFSEVESIMDNNVLRLPMLEILALYWFDGANLLIDSTKLHALKLRGYNTVELVHPESVTCVEVDEYFNCRSFLDSCINLQHFYCQNFEKTPGVSADSNEYNLIKNLSKLKSIHLDAPYYAFVSLVEEKKVLTKI